MAHPPPRPASSRAGGPASSGSGSSPKGRDGKEAPATFFLGRYRVVDEIGVGGMASVHLARMDGPGGFQKWVAIKRIHPHLVEDDQFVDMFLDEARIAAGINHANVAQVFDLGKDDNTYWIAMEYLHGEPLREVMRRAEERGGRISPELAARICSDAAEGLHAAHELRGKNGQLLGLVHRDVTPHNLFLTYDGYTKVVDFGIAKVADRLSSTRAGTLKGKLAYMSPEQVRGAEVDRTTDIFALGVVLWEITTNQRLFRMDTDLDTLEKVQACIVPPPSTIVPGYPMELEQVLMKALAKRKQDRFQTGREFSRALQSFLMRSGSFVGPEEVATFVRTVFADRIVKREAHLAWAAEVTSSHDVAALRAGKGGPPTEEVSQSGARGAPAGSQGTPSSSQPASGQRPVANKASKAAAAQAAIASQSLMDDDEDVPTTVAMREQLEAAAAFGAQVSAGRGGPPPPAAGMGKPGPAPMQQPSPASYAGNPNPASYAANAASYAANAGNGPGMRAPQPGYSANNQPGQPAAFNRPAFGEHTQALDGLSDDLGSTVALPSNLGPMPSPAAPKLTPNFGPMGGHQGFNGQPQHQQPAPQFGQPPPQFGQQQQNPYGFGQNMGGPAPVFGQPQANPVLTPAGMVGGVPMHLPAQGGPQSQIETALSLPRPDPAALWLAQQEKQKGERRNTGVLVAVIALTALCVLGIGALIFFKLRAHAASTVSPDTSASVANAAAPAPASASPSTDTAASAAPAAAPAGASAAPVASAAPSAAPAATQAPAAAPAGPAPGPAAAPKDTAKEEPGFLTVVCNPYCDDVFDQGKSLGPSPVVHLSVRPGQHRITLKKGKDSKTISVIVVSGQVTAQRVSMK